MPPAPKNRNPAVSLRDRRAWLERQAYELSQSCPATPSNPRDCPLCDLRPLTAAERKAWIRTLTLDELEYLTTYHTTCYAIKTGVRAVQVKPHRRRPTGKPAGGA